ncbi:MAG: hypothetical protein AAFX06_31485, partial [Planctomycetota bacterium]
SVVAEFAGGRANLEDSYTVRRSPWHGDGEQPLVETFMNRSGDTIVGESFLEVRAKLLEVAATFDRIDRSASDESLGDDATAKRELLRQATEILLTEEPNRAEKLQHLFSRTYESNWRTAMGLTAPDPS